MYQIFIKNNIKYLNEYLTKGFLQIKNINVSINEALIITNIIKNNINDLLNKNYTNSFNLLKNNISNDNYNKILDLYLNTINKI